MIKIKTKPLSNSKANASPLQLPSARHLLLFGIIFLGIFLGAAINAGSSEQSLLRLGDLYNALTAYQTEISFSAAFAVSLANTMLFLVLTYAFGLFALGKICIYALLLYKGYSIGFTISFFIAVFGWRGLLIAFLCIIPQALITCSVLVNFSAKSLKSSRAIFQYVNRKDQGEEPLFSIQKHTKNLVVYSLIALSAVFYDSVIAGFFIRLLI